MGVRREGDLGERRRREDVIAMFAIPFSILFFSRFAVFFFNHFIFLKLILCKNLNHFFFNKLARK